MKVNKVEFVNKGFYLDYRDLKGYIAGITIKNSSFNYTYHTIETDEERIIVENSRKNLLKSTSFKKLITLKQIHSDKIFLLDEKNLNEFEHTQIEGDGIITDLSGILIGVSTADCVPLIYLSRKNKVCGVAHAGWRGIKSKIHIKMVECFINYFCVLPENLSVIIGPHIMSCCYSVGEDLLEFFPEKYFITRNGKLYLALLNILKDDLMKIGIIEDNLHFVNMCSYCSADFLYSYRRGELKGRNLSFAGII